MLVPLTWGTILVTFPRLGIQLGITSERMYIKILPKVRGGAQRAEGSVVLRALLYDWQLLFLLSFWGHKKKRVCHTDTPTLYIFISLRDYIYKPFQNTAMVYIKKTTPDFSIVKRLGGSSGAKIQQLF